MIFKQSQFQDPTSLKRFLDDPANRAEANRSLARFLLHDLYAAQGGELLPLRPPLYNAVEGYGRAGTTEGYISAAIAPGDVGGAAAGGEGAATQPAIYFVPEPGVDTQWMNLFSRRPSTGDGESYEHASAVFSFQEIKLGGKPKLAIIEDKVEFVRNIKYGAAVSIFRVWIEDNKVWTINEVLSRGRRDALRKQATLAYQAILDQAFTAIDTESTWQATLNKGFAALERLGTLAKGQRVAVVCPSELAGLFVQIKHDQASMLLTNNQVTYPDFDVISTPHFASTDVPRLIIPGEGLYWQDRQPLRQDEDKDIMLDATDTTLDFRGNFVALKTKVAGEATSKFRQGLKLQLAAE